MDAPALAILTRLLRNERVASLGTLRDGLPTVSLVPFAAGDRATLWLHLSGLALHTKDIAVDPRVSLMIAERDDPARNPLSLARVSLRGNLARISSEGEEYDNGKSTYLAKFPDSGLVFSLGDFALYRFTPESARFVAGFGRAFDLDSAELGRATHL